MKNYLKFIVAVFGVTIAIFSSVNVVADPVDQNPDGGCSGSTGECGKTSDGKVIVGVYNT